MNIAEQALKYGGFIFKNRIFKIQVWLFMFVSICFMAVLFFYWLPVKMTHYEAEKEYKKAEEKIMQINSENAFNKHYLKVEKEVQKTEKRLMYAGGGGEIVSELYSAAERHGLKASIQNSRVRENVPAGYSVDYRELSVEGSYYSVYRYIYELERLPVMAVPEKAAIEVSAEKRGDVKAVIGLVVYRKTGEREYE